VGLEALEVEVEEVDLEGVDAATDDDQRHRLVGGGQVQITLNGLAPERDLQLLEGHLEQPACLAVRWSSSAPP